MSVWSVVEQLVDQHGFAVSVIAPPKAADSEVSMHAPSGYLTPELVDLSVANVHFVPLRDIENPWLGFEPAALDAALAELNPDAIWMYPEPVCGSTRQLLRRYYLQRKQRIVCCVIENLFQKPPFLDSLKASILFSRIDALLASGTMSTESFLSRYWLPRTRAYTTFLPTLDPKDIGRGDFVIPKRTGEFWIAFVGRICEEKGWRDLTCCLRKLPANVKAVFAGEGPDVPQLMAEIESPELAGRTVYVGSLAPRDLMALYNQADVIVVPSKTTPCWKEQFGRVIAEAMGAGLPVVGYNSGSVAEAIGDAGLVVNEGDRDALVEAIRTLSMSADLRERLGRAARNRFEREFSVKAYAARLSNLLLSPRLP